MVSYELSGLSGAGFANHVIRFPSGLSVTMQYHNVCLESFGYTLPEEECSSEQLEARLEPLYRRLRLPEGRLELMTGIRSRRFWRPGTMPGDVSVRTAERAIEAAGIDRGQIGALLHASVCRDYLEPATACSVHHRLGLPESCVVYDVSNACLGLLNGALQIANMIELGQIRAGLVVGTEGSRQLVETTVSALNADLSLTRRQIKLAVASLTIGSASCAMLLVDRELSRTGNRLTAAVARARTQHHGLCHSDGDQTVAGGMQPLMETDSEALMREGIGTGAATFADFQSESDWSVDSLDRTFCHQVGGGHRKLMLETLGLEAARDFTTLQWLGNTGSVALPITAAIGLEQGCAAPGSRLGLLGIGSGINCIMLAVEWHRTRVGADERDRRVAAVESLASHPELADLSAGRASSATRPPARPLGANSVARGAAD